jgi:tetratricopeptide (TPR) repeat protein
LAAILFADLLAEQKDVLDAAVKEKNFERAIGLYRKATEVLDEIKPRDDRRVFDAHIKIGGILNVQGDQKAALKEYKLANGIALQIAASNPESVIWQRNLANSYDKLGDVLANLQATGEATALYEKAVKVVQDLATKYPKASEWRAFAESLNTKIAKVASR